LIFLFWDAFEFLVVYFAMVETKGLSLERMSDLFHKRSHIEVPLTEIDEVFEQTNPRKYSLELRNAVKARSEA